MEKNLKNYIYVCVCIYTYTHTDACTCIKLNHFNVYQKLIEHCKSTILNLKIITIPSVQILIKKITQKQSVISLETSSAFSQKREEEENELTRCTMLNTLIWSSIFLHSTSANGGGVTTFQMMERRSRHSTICPVSAAQCKSSGWYDLNPVLILISHLPRTVTALQLQVSYYSQILQEKKKRVPRVMFFGDTFLNWKARTHSDWENLKFASIPSFVTK